MATAGSIVIDLLLRTGSFVTDTERASKQFKKLQKEATAAGKVIGTAIAAGATAAVTALKLTIDSMDEMSKAAQKVGASTEEFSKLTYAASLADVSMETLVGSLGKLTKAQAAASDGTGAQAKIFDALGVSIKNADGSLRESTDVLADFADKFQELKGSPEAMAAGFSIFGRSFQELIPLLKDGGDGIRAAGEELEAFGGVLSSEAGKNAEEFNDNLTRLETAAKALSMAVASDLLPDLVRLTESWVELAKDGGTLQETATGIANVFRVVGGVAEFVGGYFTALDNVIQGLTIGFVGLMEAARGVINLDWDQIKRGYTVANEGADLAYYGTAPASEAKKPRTSAGSSRRGGGAAMNYTAGVDPSDALRLALAGNKPTGGGRSRGAGGGGKSDADREAEQLDKAYQSLKASLTETYALFNDNTEAAQVLYDTQNGELAKLSQARKDELVLLAQKNDQQKLDAELSEAAADRLKEETDAINAHNKAVKDQIAGMEFENELIGLTSIAKEKAIALRYANVDAMSEEGQKITGLIDEYHKLNESYGFVNDALDGFGDAFADFATGAKSAKDAFGDWADDLYATAVQWLADKAMNALKDWLSGKQDGAGGYGGATGGTGGGWLSTVGNIIGSFFGGGKAGGGDVIEGRSYLVGEDGPERFVPRTAGLIVPNSGSMHGGGGNTLNQQITFIEPPGHSQRTAEQKAEKMGKKTSEIMRRNS